MSELYRLDVWNGAPLSGGEVMTNWQKGTPITIDGTPMVRLTHGVIIKADGFSTDKKAALLRAAMDVEAIGRKIIAQAERLSKEAWEVQE